MKKKDYKSNRSIIRLSFFKIQSKMEIVRKFEREKKILQEKISAGWHRDGMKIIAFSIDKVSITLYTEGVLPIRIKWDGKTLDFITNN